MRFAIAAAGFACLVLSVLLCGSVEAGWGWPRRRPALDATEIFNSADDNDDDCLSVDELVEALSKSRVQKLPVWLVTKIHAHYDDNGDGCLDLDEFKKIIDDIEDSSSRKKRGFFGFPFFRLEVPIVASEIFDSSDKRPDDGCLNRVELQNAIWKLGGGRLPLWVIDVLLDEYAADDTCMTSTEYTAFVADFRDLRRAEIFDDAGDSSLCLTATQFQKAIRAAVHASLPLWNVNMLLDLYDTDNDGCISESEFDAFMGVLEV